MLQQVMQHTWYVIFNTTHFTLRQATKQYVDVE